MSNRYIIAIAGALTLAVADPSWAAVQGAQLHIKSTLLATAFNGNVTGGLSNFEGEISEVVDITWLDENMDPVTPGPNNSFTATIGNPAVATLTMDGAFSFTFEGGNAGSTTLVLRYLDNGTPLFTSPPIPLVVVSEAVGVVVRNHGLEIARVFEATVTGELRVGAGMGTQTYDVTFLDPNGDEFALPAGVGLSLAGEAADPGKATFTIDGPFAFHLNGVATGTTDLALQIFHVDHADFTATAIPVVVMMPTDAGTPEISAPQVLALHPASPNPFNPTTVIRYDTAHAGKVRLSIFDARGRSVGNLVDDVMPAGRHTVSWNASAVPSGQYFIRLESPDGNRTTNATLLK